MFTVKATYRNETRRLTFGESAEFPTYDQLYQQLYRVFSGHSFWLSRLIFSPQPGQQFLIGTEVHTQDEYEERVTPYRGKDWPGAVLKLTVCDETPHKRPLRVLATSTDMTARRSSRRDAGLSEGSPSQRIARHIDVRREERRTLLDGLLSNGRSRGSTPPTPRPASSYQPAYIPAWGLYDPTTIPPPPVLSAPPPPPQHLPMVVPPPPIIYSSPLNAFTSSMSVQSPAPAQAASRPSFTTISAASCQSCYSTDEGRTQLQSMLDSFLHDFQRISSSTLGISVSSTPVAESSPTVGARLNASASEENMHIPGSFTPSSFTIPAPQTPEETVIHNGIMCDVCRETIVGVRHKCMQCPDYDMCTTCHGAPFAIDRHHSEHRFFEIPRPDAVIHKNILCDRCDLTVVGVRHKCLDCPNYDLCTPCMKDVAQFHNPFHEFYDIHEPGRVVVHTVYSGAGERDARGPPSPRGPRARPASTSTGTSVPPIPAPNAVTPVLHNATCNLCDSQVEGDRYKCLNCPDFDTCASCYSITKEQHPSHGFVRIAEKKDITMRGSLRKENANRHNATCDGCAKVIYGVRYKCLHPACPDYDLCANCEAHPVPVHPAAHPMLKMKTPDTIIPTVYRVGGTNVIPMEEDTFLDRTPVPEVFMPVPIPSSSILEPTMFSQGGTQADASEALSVASTVSSAPSPIPQLPVQISLSNDLYRELWPAVASEMSEMLEPMAVSAPITASQASQTEVLINFDVEDQATVPASPPVLAEIAHSSPLSGEALLATPAMAPAPVPLMEATSTATDYMEVLRRFPHDLLANALELVPAPAPVMVAVDPVVEQPTSPTQLTVGFCSEVASPFCDETIQRSRPTVQVISFKKMAVSGTTTDRYRVILSDGMRFVQGMLHTDLSQLIVDSRLQKNSVITLDFFTVNHVQGKCILIVLELTVLAVSAARIGNPTNIDQSFSHFTPVAIEPEALPVKEVRLSAGFIAEAMEASAVTSMEPLRPTVQILSIKAVNSTFSASPNTRYRIMVSDGIHYIPAMLATTLNHLVADCQLQRNDFVTLNHFTVAEVAQRKLIIILDVTMVTRQGYKIGDPTLAPGAAPSSPASSDTASPAPVSPTLAPAPVLAPAPPLVSESIVDPTLRATFLSDNNILDGQVFPPGAEFVKSWRIKNTGEVDWPETTELVWVAGDRLLPEMDERIHVGSVKAGQEVDVSAPEMKAPDAPGKYVNYWRLSDGQEGRQLFGNSIWVDITVAEASNVSEHSSEGSLASSALTMPHADMEAHPATNTATTGTALSDAGSDISLIDVSDVHSLSSEDDWEDSRSHVTPPRQNPQNPGEVEYVVLYEEDSPSEDD